MIRQCDLRQYLPAFLQEYDEFKQLFSAENPEFCTLWNNADSTLKNMFIETADAAGIARLEKMLRLSCKATDTIEDRRSRIMSKWQDGLPYTMSVLENQLNIMCQGSDYTIVTDFPAYKISVSTHIREPAKIAEIKCRLSDMLPANLRFDYINTIFYPADGAASLFTGVAITINHQKITVEVQNYGLE